MNTQTRNRIGVILWAGLLPLLLCACGGYAKQLEQGRLQLERGQYEAAAASYGAAIKRKPRRADAYEGRGDVYAALADHAKSYGGEQSAYRRAAIADYKKACELDDSPRRKTALTDYYLRLGDEALLTARDESDPNSAYAYDIANSYYQAALDFDRLNGSAYGRMVCLLLLRDKPEEARELLRKARAVTGDPALTAQLGEVNAQIAALEAQTRRAEALRLLRNAPYYGDPDMCRMSAAQATAFAKLLSDGLSGKFYGFSGYGKPLYEKPVYWDEPYPVVGYGSYETNRGKVILADLSGDGVPYLCLFSTLVGANSFQIYGWAEGELKLAAGEESWGGHQNGELVELSDGSVVLAETMTGADGAHSGQVFRFRDGGAVVTESWHEAREDGETVVRVTRGGAQATYARAQWEPIPDRVSPEARDLPYAPFSDTLSAACPLRDMAEYLNEWAAALSDGAAETVKVPAEYSDRHRMAAAMLHKLFVLDHLSIDADTRLCYVKLIDCNGDGVDELLAAFSGAYRAENGAACQFALYEWKDGELLEHPGGSRFDELRVARDRNGGAKGILGIEREGTLVRYAYAFLNNAEEFQFDATNNRYAIVKRGQSAAIAESEYAVLTGRYETLESLIDFTRPNADRNYERVIASLYNMRG